MSMIIANSEALKCFRFTRDWGARLTERGGCMPLSRGLNWCAFWWQENGSFLTWLQTVMPTSSFPNQGFEMNFEQ